MCMALTLGVILCIQNHFDRYWIGAEIVIKIATSNDFWWVLYQGSYKYVLQYRQYVDGGNHFNCDCCAQFVL